MGAKQQYQSYLFRPHTYHDFLRERRAAKRTSFRLAILGGLAALVVVAIVLVRFGMLPSIV